jgi:adenosylmethionine---8-amino-7-oxononanoate aminotransferase
MAANDTTLPELARSPFWHPYTSVPHDGPRRLIARAEGSYLYEASGHRLLDATSSWWCQVHGHCHPRLVGALTAQARVLDQVLVAPHSHPVAEELSQKLVDVAGAPYEKVFFSDNGSTAVEVALKMALQYWKLKGVEGKTRFLSLDRAYHGDTLGAMAVGSPSDFSWAFPKWSESTIQAPAPHPYRSEFKDAKACEEAAAVRFVELLEQHRHELAAVILEPLVLGAGGLVLHSPDYLERIVSVAKTRGILVIFDEVFTGFGRTGKMFAFNHISSRPDLVCLSKGLTSGMLPLGATLARAGIFEQFIGGMDRRLQHGHTFTANALSTAVALESLKIFEEENVLGRNEVLIEMFSQNVDRFRRLPFVGDVRHLGMIWALELVRDKNTKETFTPAGALGWRLAEKLWERGVWVRPLRQVMYIIPPYCITPGELEHCLDQVGEVLDESI